MCEFTVVRKSGSNTEKIGEDVIFFQYDEKGQARFADILGRSKCDFSNGFVYEINMLENRHDITLVESEIVPYFVKLMQTIYSDHQDDKKKRAEDLIEAIKKHVL